MTDAALEAALARFAGLDPVLVALDFDGVLAPIVDHPDDARPLPASAAAVQGLVASPRVRVALVSGRRLGDLVAVAQPPSGTLLVGSHGAERGVVMPDGEVRAEPPNLTEDQRTLLTELTDAVESMAADAQQHGAWVEHKPAGVVLHTRAMPETAAASLEAEVMDAVGERWRDGVRALHGKRVVELSVLPATKGVALEQLRADLGVAAVLYAGDDVTDEDALATLRPGDIGIKVGEGRTHAAHRVADPAAMADVLGTLALRIAADDLTAGGHTS